MSELNLVGKPPLTRQMLIRLARGRRLYVSLYPIGDPVAMVAYAGSEITDCHLERVELKSKHSCLWLGWAAFDVSEDEADAIQAAYPALRVERTGSAIESTPA